MRRKDDSTAVWLGALVSALVVIAPPWSARSLAGEDFNRVTLGRSESCGLLVLSDGTAVLWGNNAHFRIRPANGTWSVIALPDVTSIEEVVADSEGVLVWGSSSDSSGKSTRQILLVDAGGAVRDQWKPGDSLLSIFSVDGDRWATAFGKRPLPVELRRQFDGQSEAGPMVDRLLSLKPNGQVQRVGDVEALARITSFRGGTGGHSRVDCVPFDLTMESYRFPYCTLVEPKGWRRSGLWTRRHLFTCGDFLIEPFDGGIDIVVRNKPPRITVRRLDDGGVAGVRRLAPEHAIACGADGELLIGKTDVQGLALPSLRTLWRLPSPHGRVVALARDGDHVLAATPSGTVFTLLPPKRKSDRDSKRPAR